MDTATAERGAIAPTFIVGCPRSGTTLLASLCDRHSQVAVPPETHFFSKFLNERVPRGRRGFTTSYLSKLFVECQYTRDLKLSSESLLARMGERDITIDEFYRQALDCYAAACGKPHWIEKTPKHLLCSEKIFEWYPTARMICIFRDGRDTALSCRNMPWAVAPIRQYAALWCESAAALLRCQEQWPANVLAIRYENLLTAPVETLSAVMKFAGLEFEPSQLAADRQTGVVPDWEMKVKQNVFSEIDPGRAYAWKRTATPGQIRVMNSMMRPYLERLGYEPGDGSPAWPLRVYDAAINPIFRITCSHKLHRVRWWIRVLMNPVFPVSPHYSFKESRRRAEGAGELQGKRVAR